MSERSSFRVLRAGGLQARVEEDGGRISSIRVGRGTRAVELLLRTPWADDPAGAWTMPGSADEWHRRYPGGWHLLLPRPLGPATVDGVEQPFHGEAAWRRWSLASRGDEACALSVTLRSVPLRIERDVRLEATGGASRVVVTTTVTNIGGRAVRFGWAEHPAFDATLFSDSCVALAGGPVPIVDRGSGRFDDLDNLTGSAVMTSASTGYEIALEWDATLFARTYVWQERGAVLGFPWHGLVDAVAVEPASQRHDHPTDVLGEVALGPGAARRTAVTLTVRERR